MSAPVIMHGAPQYEPHAVLLAQTLTTRWAELRDAELTPADDTAPAHPSGLTALELAVLEFADRHAATLPPGHIENVVRDLLGLTYTAYLGRLSLLLDDERAVRYAPHTVSRLRRQRDTAQRWPRRRLTEHEPAQGAA